MNTITDNMYLLAIVIPLLTACLGYTLAKLLAMKHRSGIEKAHEATQAALAHLKTAHNSLSDQYQTNQQALHQLALDHRGLETRYQSQSEQLEKAESERTDHLNKAEQALASQHAAEKSYQASQTALEENHKQQALINQRLHHALNDITIEREKLNQQISLNAELDKQAKTHEIQAQENAGKYLETKQRLENQQVKLDTLQQQHTELTAAYTELKTALDERDKSHAQQLAQFDEQKLALGQQFKVLANDILDLKTKALQENSQSTLSALINPFQQSINAFKKEVHEIHHRETVQQAELRKELDLLKQLNHKMTTEAHELSTALRGQKKLQGNWGELILENVLDRSGLQLGVDYKREVSFTTESGRQRPDAIVYLPQQKHLVIDAKVSLAAYTRFINSEETAERHQALGDHVRAMGDRINELADRDYYKLPGLNSPEMVFMFVPIESAFVDALKADEGLFQKAIENNVLVATPTTLLTSLNIVRQLWRYEDQNKHTAALAGKADTVFKKLNAFLGSFEAIKKGLDKANEAYTKAEGQLVSGRGNLVKQVGEFKKLAPAIKAELPTYFTDKAELEIDYIPPAEQLASREPQAETAKEKGSKGTDSVSAETQ